MCPPVSPYEGASVVHSPHTMRVFLIWKRRYADVRAGTQAPPLRFRLGRLRVGRLVSFGWIACGRLMPFGWIVRKWLFCLCGIVHKCITVFGRGGACVPARVALQGRIRLSSLRTMRVFLVWRRRCADVRAGTQAPPLRFRLGRLGVGRLISFGMNYAWNGWCRLGGLRVNGYFVCVGCVEKYDGDW